MKTSVRALFAGVAIALFFTFTLAAIAQEKPATEATSAAAVAPVAPPPPETPVVAEPPLRRLDEPSATPPSKAKKSNSQRNAEREEAAKRRAEARAARAESRTGQEVVNVFSDSVLEEGNKADVVVAVFGNAISAGEVADGVGAVFGDNRVTGPVANGTVAVFGNSYINAPVKEGVVVVFGDLELGPKANIEGGVVCVGGTITRDPATVVKGGVQNVLPAKVNWLRAWIRECFLWGRPLAFAPNLGWAWTLAGVFLALYFFSALLFRSGVEKCLVTLSERPGFSVLAALLTTLITPVLTILLAATGIGLAAVPFIGLGLLCATLFGKVVILAWLGRRFTGFFGNGPLNHVAFATLLGGLIVLGLYTVPVLGFLVFKLIGWIGLGAVVYTVILGMKRDKPATPPAASTPPSQTRPTSPPPASFVPPDPAAATGAAAAAAGTFVPPVVPVPPVAPVPPVVEGAALRATPGEFSPQGAVEVTATTVPPTPEPSAAAASPASEPPPVAPNMSAGFGAASFTAPPPPVQSYAPPPVSGPVISATTLPRAGFWIRIAAVFIDTILIGIVFGAMMHGGPIFMPALAAYAAAMWKFKGTTIGGIICGLKVVRLDDRPLDWPTAIVRSLGCFLSLAVGGLGFLWVIFDSEKQSWHDKIAGTTVVRVPKGVSLL